MICLMKLNERNKVWRYTHVYMDKTFNVHPITDDQTVESQEKNILTDEEFFENLDKVFTQMDCIIEGCYPGVRKISIDFKSHLQNNLTEW